MAAIEIKSYQIIYFGGPQGFANVRAQINLLDANNEIKSFLRFQDPGFFVSFDNVSGGTINIFLPSARLEGIIDVLRNEKPIFVDFINNRGVFGTNLERVGEGEQTP